MFLHAIFLYLHKAYDALDRFMFLGILEGYDVGTRALCLLRRYWGQHQMVARAGGYYGEPFRRDRGLNQGDPLSSTIFNVVLDAVFLHWGSLVEEILWWGSSNDNDAAQSAGSTTRERDDGRRRTGEGQTQLEVKTEFLYEDNRMLTSTDPGWL